MVRVEIVQEPIDLAQVRESVTRPENGAVLIFEGIVRNHHEGLAVTHIDYHAYEAMALVELRRIAEEAASKHEIEDMAVIHRIGHHEVGDTSLVVAVGSHHRRPAFEAGLAVIDEIKRRVPIWKKEHGPGGARWVKGTMPGN